MEKLSPNRAQLFVRNKYTVFTMGSIVALRSINKFFPESYSSAATLSIVKRNLSLNMYTKKSPSESCTCTCMLYEIVS